MNKNVGQPAESHLNALVGGSLRTIEKRMNSLLREQGGHPLDSQVEFMSYGVISNFAICARFIERDAMGVEDDRIRDLLYCSMVFAAQLSSYIHDEYTPINTVPYYQNLKLTPDAYQALCDDAFGYYAMNPEVRDLLHDYSAEFSIRDDDQKHIMIGSGIVFMLIDEARMDRSR